MWICARELLQSESIADGGEVSGLKRVVDADTCTYLQQPPKMSVNVVAHSERMARVSPWRPSLVAKTDMSATSPGEMEVEGKGGSESGGHRSERCGLELETRCRLTAHLSRPLVGA